MYHTEALAGEEGRSPFSSGLLWFGSTRLGARLSPADFECQLNLPVDSSKPAQEGLQHLSGLVFSDLFPTGHMIPVWMAGLLQLSWVLQGCVVG